MMMGEMKTDVMKSVHRVQPGELKLSSTFLYSSL